MNDHSIGRAFRAATLGILLGGVAGFTLGLLLAPEEGRKIRRKLAYQLDNIGKQVSDLVDKTLNPESEGEARREGDALVADAHEKAEKIRSEIDALMGEIQQESDDS